MPQIYNCMFCVVSLPDIPFTNSLAAIHKKLLNYSHCVWLCEVRLIAQCLQGRFFALLY